MPLPSGKQGTPWKEQCATDNVRLLFLFPAKLADGKAIDNLNLVRFVLAQAMSQFMEHVGFLPAGGCFRLLMIRC